MEVTDTDNSNSVFINVTRITKSKIRRVEMRRLKKVVYRKQRTESSMYSSLRNVWIEFASSEPETNRIGRWLPQLGPINNDPTGFKFPRCQTCGHKAMEVADICFYEIVRLTHQRRIQFGHLQTSKARLTESKWFVECNKRLPNTENKIFYALSVKKHLNWIRLPWTRNKFNSEVFTPQPSDNHQLVISVGVEPIVTKQCKRATATSTNLFVRLTHHYSTTPIRRCLTSHESSTARIKMSPPVGAQQPSLLYSIQLPKHTTKTTAPRVGKKP